MLWLEMTGPEVALAAKKVGVAILPIGATERHGDHLPVGMDTLTVTNICAKAVDKEDAVIFPTVFTGMNTELRHAPGSISVRPELIMQYLEEICDEIGRNGFAKIILVSGHGGNRYMLPQLVMNTLDSEKPYVLYYVSGYNFDPKVGEKVLETKVHAHACECETSVGLHLFPQLIHMDRVPDKPVESQKPVYLEGIYSNIDWFASFSENVSGEPGKATPAKGKALFNSMIDRLADAIRRVKKDNRGPKLLKAFYKRVSKVGK